jgi:hypothetical protein
MANEFWVLAQAMPVMVIVPPVDCENMIVRIPLLVIAAPSQEKEGEASQYSGTSLGLKTPSCNTT